jgi:pyridoxal phosphate enzyme (YggS family)
MKKRIILISITNFKYEMDTIKAIQEIINTIPENVKLVAVSKTKPIELIKEAYDKANQRIFGENKVQELTQKYNSLPKDIEWHFIGHLQTNKVKYIASFIDMLHAVDSLKLLKTVDKEAKKHNRIINCLLQIHIAEEESKFGLTQDQLIELLEDYEYRALRNVRVCGLMGMSTHTEDTMKIQSEFQYIKRLFESIKRNYFSESEHFKELSIGMSGDYKLAIECGSTMIRLGSSLFGERIYNK